MIKSLILCFIAEKNIQVDKPEASSQLIRNESPGLTEKLYRHLLESLKNTYNPGDKIISEREAARRFGVSRPTAARAMTRLMDEGIIESRKGAGRFYRRPPLDYDLSSLVSFTSRCQSEGVIPTTEVLEFTNPGLGDIPDDVIQNLQLLPGEGTYSFTRRRFANGKPVILERRWIAARFCPALTKSDVAGSLYKLLKDRYNLNPAGARQIIRPVIIRGKDRALFREDEDGSAFEITATGYLEGGVPLWYEHTLYLGGAYELHNRLGPLSTARPAVSVLRIS